MKLYTLENGLWESSFILDQLLPQGHVNFIDHLALEQNLLNCDVFAFNSRLHGFSQILETIQKTKPKIIILLSDEHHQEKKHIYNHLGNECELLLRQYHHSEYTYTKNTIHIPLGYTNGCKAYSNKSKNLKWAFFGAMKSDRNDLMQTFQSLNPFVFGNGMPKGMMCRFYASAEFVPCGRGYSSLDCFRLYEASMNGATPVIVGSQEEIETTFRFEENPPWVFARTWSEAAEICSSYTPDPLKLTAWWENRIAKIRAQVGIVLGK